MSDEHGPITYMPKIDNPLPGMVRDIDGTSFTLGIGVHGKMYTDHRVRGPRCGNDFWTIAPLDEDILTHRDDPISDRESPLNNFTVITLLIGVYEMLVQYKYPRAHLVSEDTGGWIVEVPLHDDARDVLADITSPTKLQAWHEAYRCITEPV